MANVIQRVSNWLLGDYPVATTEIGSGSSRKLIQHVHSVDSNGDPTSGGDGAILDGASPTIKAAVLDLTTSNGLAVAIVDGNGDQITSFGGGTQYTEGDTDASITGTAMLMEGAANALVAAQGTAADGLLVNLGSNNDVTVAGVATSAKQDTGNTSLASIDGKITAVNTGAVTISAALPAGTNNIGDVDVLTVPADPFGVNADAASATGSISAKLRFIASTGIPITGTVTVGSHAVTNAGTFLVQENGGSLTALQIIDDWDESDRCKSNIIVGQAGVAADVGATGATVQRVVIANNAGRTLTSAGGSASSSGNNTLVAAGSARLKVHAFSLSTTSTTAVTCIFQSGAGGTELWRCVLQAPTSVSTGANLAVTPPAWLFATASATLLNLNLSGAITVHWSVSYCDEA